MRKVLSDTHKDWEEYLQVDQEYLWTEAVIREQFPRCYNLYDCDNPNDKCVTFGKSVTQDDGSEKSLESFLTHEIERKSNLCLDYIFVLENRSNLRLSGTKVETFFCDSNAINVFSGQQRGYTQFSDHYGISTVIYQAD